MAGRCPQGLEEQFIADVKSGLATRDLQVKYDRARSTIKEWKQGLRKQGKLPPYKPKRKKKRPDNIPEPGTTFTETKNTAEARSTGPRTKTLPQLIEAAEVDEDVWATDDWGVKKWELGAKIKKGHLEWTSGRLDGTLDYEGLGVEELWSVWAKFIRREPIAIKPVVQPAECPVTYNPPDPPKKGVRQGLLIPDAQFGYERDIRTGKLDPFHDRGVFDIALQIAYMLQPTYIAFLGDFLDLTMWTDKYARLAEYFFTTQPSIFEAHWWLRQLRQLCPNSDIDIFEGNHDMRMRSALNSHLQEAHGLKAADEIDLPPAMSPQKLLALHKLCIGWVADYPDGERWMGPLRLQHGNIARKPPGGTARAVAESTDADTAFGHVHRAEFVTRRIKSRNGTRTIRTYTPGCACRTDGIVPGSSADDNWNQGLGVVTYTDDQWSVAHVEVVNGEALWNGQRFVARDRVPDLRTNLPDYNW